MDVKATIIRWLCMVPEPYYGWLRRFCNWYELTRHPEKVTHPGDLHSDKTFYVIRDLPPYAGLGSWYDRMLGYLERAEKKGYVPVVVPQPPAQPDAGDWTCFFNGPTVMSDEEVVRQRNIVEAIPHGVIYKRYNRKNIAIRHRLGNAIKLSDSARTFVEPRMPRLTGAVGVMFRGTDYRKSGSYCPTGHAKVPSVDAFCDQVAADLQKWGVDDNCGDHLFVVTEEQEALDAIRSRFPKCQFIAKERFSNFQFDKWLAYQRLPNTSPMENNLLYLLDIYALAKCDYLIGGMNGCVMMALNLNGNRYKGVDIINTGVN